MAYEKLTPESFLSNMKNQKYKGLTGARRAIGKANWSDADKAAVVSKAEKFYGAEKSSAPSQKVRSVGAKAPKKASVKSVGQAKKAAKGGRAPRSARSPQSVAETEQAAASFPNAVVQRDDPSAMRHKGAAEVISAFATRPLNPSEKKLYELCVAEMTINTSDEAKAACEGSTAKTAPIFQSSGTGCAAPTPTLPTGLIPRVQISLPTPSGSNTPKSLDELTPAEREQLAHLERAGKASGFDPHKQD